MKKKTIITIILILLIMLVAYGAFFVHNYTILEEISKKEQEYMLRKNMYYEEASYTEANTEEDISKIYYKENIIKQEIPRMDDKVVVWKNGIEGETIDANNTQKTVLIIKEEPYGISGYPYTTDYTEQSDIIKISATTWIATEKVGQDECYKVKNGDSIKWYKKEDGTIRKVEQGSVKLGENTYKVKTEYRDFQFDTVTDEQVAKPNIEGYRIVEPEEHEEE